MAYLFLSPGQSKPKSEVKTSTPTPEATPHIRLSLFASGLTNITGIYSTGQSDDRRLFVLDRSGLVRIVDKDGQVVAQPFLDISAKVLSAPSAESEMGLLGLAFAPDYAKTGKFYVNYIDKSQSTRIEQYTVTKDANIADASSGQAVLTFNQKPYSNHKAGDMAFGKDGYLYIATGDGGSAGDPDNHAQDLKSMLGKILRLDVSQLPYKIPPTNPFVGQADKNPEIWDYGLRNPWRISFDRSTHELYIADVGQGKLEEVNVEMTGKGGHNYGWRCYEADAEYTPAGCPAKNTVTFPAFRYDHSGGNCSITGGYVYRGSLYPALAGKYFYGDYCSGRLWYAYKQGDSWQQAQVVKAPYRFTTFGQDSRGELYVADFSSGSLYTIIDSKS